MRQGDKHFTGVMHEVFGRLEARERSVMPAQHKEIAVGVQLNIEIPELLHAGWKVWQEKEDHEAYDESTGEQYVQRTYYLVISKDDHVFASYAPDSFCADCNAWGNNKALFEAAGLLSIPHILS